MTCDDVGGVYHLSMNTDSTTSSLLAFVFVADLAAIEFGEGYGCTVSAEFGIGDALADMTPITATEFAACMTAAQADFACTP